jgi:hypothetical protein
MGILEHLGLKQDEKQSVAYELFGEAFNELLEKLYLTRDYKVSEYGLPKIVVSELKDAEAQYDPDTHTLTLKISTINDYLNKRKRVDELTGKIRTSDKLLERYHQGEMDSKKRYHLTLEEYHKKGYESERTRGEDDLKQLDRAIRGTSIHEGTHTVRYRIHPEKTKEERHDPTRREIEDAVADLAQAVFLDLDENEIVSYIERYKKATASNESSAKLGQINVKLHGYLLDSDKNRGVDLEDAKKELEKSRRLYETIQRTSEGYRLGFLVALGIKDKSQEEKMRFVSELVKEDDPENILNRLQEVGEHGKKVFRKNRDEYWRKSSPGIPEGKTNWMADIETNEAYPERPKPKPKKENPGSSLTLILLTFVIIGSLSFFLLNRKTTSMAVSVYNSNIFFLFISIAVVLAGYLFLIRKVKL